MRDLRFKAVVLSAAGYSMFCIPKANYMIKHKDKYTSEERFAYARRICRHMAFRAKTRTKVFGLENLPKNEGYIMFSNHQGKFDALAVFTTVPEPCGVLWEEKSADRLLARQVNGLVDGITISFTDPKDQIRALNRLANEVKDNGRNFLIFPEGGYKDNRNTLQEFKSGCFMAALKAQCPIVPVCLYDSWKSMNTNRLTGVVNTEIHYLDPIPYEKYKDMKKKEIGEMIKSIIQSKIEEIEEGKKHKKSVL